MPHFFPQDFDSVQFRSVRRQIVQLQPLLRQPAPLFFHGVAFMDAGIAGYDNTQYPMWLDRDVIKKGDDIVTRGVLLLGGPY